MFTNVFKLIELIEKLHTAVLNIAYKQVQKQDLLAYNEFNELHDEADRLVEAAEALEKRAAETADFANKVFAEKQRNITSAYNTVLDKIANLKGE